MITDWSAAVTVGLAITSGVIQLRMFLMQYKTVPEWTMRAFLFLSGAVTLYFAIPYTSLALGASVEIGATRIRPAINMLLISTALLTAFAYQYHRAVAEMLAIHQETEGERRRIRLLQDQFVNILFHELRTPLTGILAYTELALMDGIGQSDELLSGIRRSGLRLKILIDQAVALRRSVDMAPFDVAAMIRDLLTSELNWVATRRHLGQVELTYSGNDYLIIEGDESKLRTAVLELIRNAIKASPEEGGLVQVGAMAYNGGLTLWVTDNGTGMEPERLQALFSAHLAFSYLDMSDTRRNEGTGLGLVVVRHVVDLHRGKLEADSVKGMGSTFRIRLERFD